MNPKYAVALDQGLGWWRSILVDLGCSLSPNNCFLCYYPTINQGRPSVHWVRGSAIALGIELYKATVNYGQDGAMVFRMHEGDLRLMPKDRKSKKVRSDMVYTIRNAEGGTDEELRDAIEEFCRREPLFVKRYKGED